MKATCTTALMVVLALSSIASAADERLVVKVYNVSDLIWARKDYPFESAISMPPTMPPTRGEGIDPRQIARGGGGGGGQNPHPAGGGGLFGQAAQQQQQIEMTKELVELLVQTVQPPSWVQNGGLGSTRALGGMLVVSQTQANQEAVANLLAQVRAEASNLVTVRAHWLLLAPQELEALIARREDRKGKGVEEIDPAALAKLGEKTVHYRAQTSCFNGQTVHIASGRGRTVVTKVEAVIGNGEGLYNPDAQIVQSGAMLQVTPILSQDANQAVVDVQSVVSEWDAPAAPAEIRTPTTRPSSEMLDRMNVLVQQLRTTVQVPVGKPVLVGGMTFEPSTKGGNSPQMYLIIEVSAGN